MVQSLVDLKERQDRVLTIVKGKYGLKNKSEAINLIVEQYEKAVLEPELRPEYREELLKIDKGKFKKFSSVERLRRELLDA
ncbi:MAG: DUF2683 family protein [Candidatus Micrarchaeota archaeon]|nr:DUF2683 family protein [Candidatus Micrarchaeota archaeon]